MIQNNNLIVIKVKDFSFRLVSNLIDDKKVSQRLGRDSNSLNTLKNKDFIIKEFEKTSQNAIFENTTFELAERLGK